MYKRQAHRTAARQEARQRAQRASPAGQTEATAELWTAPDRLTFIGIWECTPGRFTADRSKSAEYCHILSGSATVVNADGSGARTVKGGDLLVLPLGWKGEWTVHSHIRKLYLINVAS